MARQPQIRNNWTKEELTNLQDLPPEKAQAKIDTVNAGSEVAMEHEIFPESRSCNDIIFVLVFVLMLGAVLGASIFFGRSLGSVGQYDYGGTTVAPVMPTAAPTAAPLAPVAPAAALARRVQAPIQGCCPIGEVALATAECNAGTSLMAGTCSAWLISHQNCCVPAGDIQAQPGTPGATPAPSHALSNFTKNVKPMYIVLGTLAGTMVAVAASLFLVFLSKHCGKCVVYTALLFSCALMILTGIALVSSAAAMGGVAAVYNMAIGGLMIAGGVCFAVCILACWHSLIEFTAAVVTCCGEITLDNCCMMIIAVGAAFFSACWSIVVAIALDGVLATYGDALSSETCKNGWCGYVFFGSFFFFWIWGCMVSSAVCYTTFCGVFSRWYYSDDDRFHELYDSPLCPSFFTAITTSFGSICFGTFLVAIIQTAEFVARMAQRDAAENGNIVCCVMLCCVRCILECLGDIIEYFNEWAYVQCAIRGSTFCESAKIVFSLCTVANIYAIWATLLINSVVNLGSFLSAFIGAAVGFGVGYIGSWETAAMGAVTGLVAGNSVGWCCMSVFSAGSKTLLTCWAENPETLLHKSQETDLGEQFRAKGGLNYF